MTKNPEDDFEGQGRAKLGAVYGPTKSTKPAIPFPVLMSLDLRNRRKLLKILVSRGGLEPPTRCSPQISYLAESSSLSLR
jgi:hypothetical protein